MQSIKADTRLALGALGVVYGDVGTSPLYTLGTCFNNISITEPNILGVISLIFWTLIIVVSTCYVTIFLNANNDGEGGVLALLGLFNKKTKLYRYLFFIGIFGAGLLISDGMLTPAVSVMSSVEGLKVISPGFSSFVIPITVAILLSLFIFQRYGTGKIGGVFGPILLIWFVVIGLIGLRQILNHPIILNAVNPYYAMQFFEHNGFKGWLLLGSIFLCITGAEAMYADLGQFGKTPIRLGWFFVVLPGLILSFFGEGANLLVHPDAIASPFYLSAPYWGHYPLLILATVATIIASQSVISASYSLTKQAILLDVMPRLKLIQTSVRQTGQIYVPQITLIFAIGTISLVLFFKSSNALTSAYGIAINLEMMLMAFFVICFAYEKWKWSWLKIICVFSVFVLIDFAFLSANIFKIPSGGWMPLVFTTVALVIMISWHKGLRLLQISFHKKEEVSLAHQVNNVSSKSFDQLLNLDAIFITNIYDKTGACFLNYFENMNARPTQWLLVTVLIKPIPRVPKQQRYEVTASSFGIPRLTIYLGFMEPTNVPRYLKEINKKQLLPFTLNLEHSLYFVEDIVLAASDRGNTIFSYWQKKLFVSLFESTSGTLAALDYFKLPRSQTITIGAYVDF